MRDHAVDDGGADMHAMINATGFDHQGMLMPAQAIGLRFRNGRAIAGQRDARLTTMFRQTDGQRARDIRQAAGFYQRGHFRSDVKNSQSLSHGYKASITEACWPVATRHADAEA